MDQSLLQSALSAALDDADLRDALSRLAPIDPSIARTLSNAVIDAAEPLAALVPDELAALVAATQAVTQLEEALAGDPHAHYASISPDYALLTAQIAQALEFETAERARISRLRTSKEIRKAKESASKAMEALTNGGDRPRPSRVLRLRRRQEPDIGEQLDSEYREQLERLQAHKHAIADLITARKRMELQLARDEQTRWTPLEDEEGPPELTEARLAAGHARAEAERALVEKAVLPFCRTWINNRAQEGREARYRSRLGDASGAGLDQMASRHQYVDTAARARVARLLTMSAGSIGIAGPRGSGKTTLLREFCEPSPPLPGAEPVAPESWQFLVAAPVRFSPLDFILHLSDRACGAIVDAADLAPSSDPLGSGSSDRPPRILLATGVLISTVGALLVAYGLAISSRTPETNELLLAGGIATLCILAGVLVASSELTRSAGAAIVSAFGATLMIATMRSGNWGLIDAATIAATSVLGFTATSANRALEWSPRFCTTTACVSVTISIAAPLIAAVTGHDVSSSYAAGALLLAIGGLAVGITSVAADPIMGSSATPAVPALALLRTGAIASIGAGGVLLGLGWLRQHPSAVMAAGVVLIAAGVPCLRSAMTTRQALRARNRERIVALNHDPQLSYLTSATREFRDRIAYQQATRTAWSGKVGLALSGLPVSAELERSGERELTRNPVSLPKAIDDLRDYLRQVTTITKRSFVIGIDELDKIASADDAEALLNELKALFGVPGCFFLVSVSEDAVASFERRGMPFRDAMDSSFDEVIRVEHPDTSFSVELLNSRTLNMPWPYIALCHAIGGGLPRDVVRVARHLFDLHADMPGASMSDLVTALVTAEFNARRNGTSAAICRLGPSANLGQVLGWLSDHEGSVPTLAALQAGWRPANPNTADPAAFAIDRLTHEIAGYWYFAATLIEFFDDTRSIDDFEALDIRTGPGSIEHLARARQAFAVDPGIVFTRVSQFRTAWRFHTFDPMSQPVAVAPAADAVA